MTVPLIEARGVHKHFRGLQVLKGIDLRVDPGEVVCLMGPSGSGKTTFLRCVNHLESVDAGELEVAGELVGYRRGGGKLYELREREIARHRCDVGMVFQRFNLFPHMTALQNVTLGPRRVSGRPRADAVAEGRALLERVGLADKLDAYPHTLSGGQQQRVAIARALAMKPKLVLFDEPTSALDPELVGEVLNVMAGLARDGMTMVVVTHEVGFARQVADRVVFMADGQVVEQGPPNEVIDRPATERAATFFGQVLG
jgi:polar amino acid transport system ATP-binding protein